MWSLRLLRSNYVRQNILMRTGGAPPALTGGPQCDINMSKMYYLILSLALLMTCSGQLEAASMKVGPARFIIHNVVPGRAYDVYKETGLQLTIYNDSATDKMYLLSTHRPSEGGTWEKGYQEIPDPKWCWFDNDTIEVGANSNASARFHVMIPGEGRYYNQHWVVTLNIAGKPRSGGGLGVAINVRAQIETQAKVDLNGVTPDGLIGVVPSVITLKTQGNGKVVVLNNSTTNETYNVYQLTDTENIHKYISAGFIPLPEPDWLKLGDGSLTIPAGSRKTLTMEASVPEKAAHSNRKYEAICFIEGRGTTGLVRVRIMGADNNTEDMK